VRVNSKELGGVRQFAGQAAHARHHVLEELFLLAQFLRALLIAPDLRSLEFPSDLDQPLFFGIDVKGTSAAR
jgi:hypothetical protein